MDKLGEYLSENSLITNKEAKNLGYSRQVLSKLAQNGNLERLKRGVYLTKNSVIDDFALILSNSNRVIFSHHTALFLYNLSDRAPSVFHISVPQGYNASRLKKRFPNLIVHYINKEMYETGKTFIKTPLGNTVAIYDIERTICDIIMDRGKIDKQIFTSGIISYFKSSNKDLRKLLKYSKIFKIEDQIRKYMEVLS